MNAASDSPTLRIIAFTIDMQTGITWSDISVRLLMTFVAGAIIGVNRGEHGRPAGLRTTILVCLTASASMILANLLLRTAGKAPDSFVTMDVMRLPLGILTGMGFIGAGAILHKGSMVLGVTTASTLWYTTLMGFCFGAGEFALGVSLLALGILVLWCLKWVETHFMQRQEATLTVRVAQGGPSQDEIVHALVSQGWKLSAQAVLYAEEGQELRYEVSWHASGQDTTPPSEIAQLASHPGIKELDWIRTVKG